MALTNVIRETRRELTESGVGILIAAVVIGVIYLPGQAIGTWFGDATTTPNVVWLWTLIGMVLLFFGGWLALLITHKVGEKFCNNLAQRGIELRGVRQPRRW